MLMITIVFAHCVLTATKMSKVQQFHGFFTSLKTVSTLESQVYLLILIAFNMMGGSYKFNH